MRRTTFVTAAAIGMITTTLLGGAAQASTTAPSTGYGNHRPYLCLSPTLPAQCADLLNDAMRDNQKVIIDSSTAGQGLGWNPAYQTTVTQNSPFDRGSGLNHRYAGAPVDLILKTTPTGHNGCLSASAGYDTQNVGWKLCTTGFDFELWVRTSSNYFINVGASDYNYEGTLVSNRPMGLSDVNGTDNGATVTTSSTDNPWWVD